MNDKSFVEMTFDAFACVCVYTVYVYDGVGWDVFFFCLTSTFYLYKANMWHMHSLLIDLWINTQHPDTIYNVFSATFI